MRFHPSEHPVPVEHRTAESLLRPLRVDDVEIDYQAVVESRRELRAWGQSDWPADDFGLTENLEDLRIHQSEHERGVAYTYSVVTPDGSSCLGCVYINPLPRALRGLAAEEAVLARARQDDACLAFWVRSSRLADGLETRLLAQLRRWLSEDWHFGRVYYRANSAHTRQLDVLCAAGLEECLRLPSVVKGVSWLLLCEPNLERG